MEIICRQVSSPKELINFINFPHELYRDDQNYVAEMYLAQKKMFDTKTYPFFKYGTADLFMVYKNGFPAGRIAAINNPRYNNYHQSNIGFFGFFDCIDDAQVAASLFSEVKKFGIRHQFDRIIGPTNFTTNETSGTLINGFFSPPVVMMTYNFAYYKDLLESLGLVKEMDLFAYKLIPEKVNQKSLRLLPLLEKRLAGEGITIKHLHHNTIHREAAKIKEVYHKAWEKNWGFVPFTDEEFDYLKNDLSQIMDTGFTMIAEKNGTPLGFCIAIPNINEILIKYRKGKLFPFGFLEMLYKKNKTKSFRILALGVVPAFRKKGIEAVFYAKCLQAGINKSLDFAEASWILENNPEMNQGLINLHAELYKTYRLYSFSLE